MTVLKKWLQRHKMEKTVSGRFGMYQIPSYIQNSTRHDQCRTNRRSAKRMYAKNQSLLYCNNIHVSFLWRTDKTLYHNDSVKMIFVFNASLFYWKRKVGSNINILLPYKRPFTCLNSPHRVNSDKLFVNAYTHRSL